MNEEQITTRLRALADELEPLDTRREQIFGERLALWEAARALGWTQAQCAEPSRVTEGAVTQAFKKKRDRAVQNSTTRRPRARAG